MRMIHNNKFNLIHDDKDFEPDDKEEINLFIFCMCLVFLMLFFGLIYFVYQNL